MAYFPNGVALCCASVLSFVSNRLLGRRTSLSWPALLPIVSVPMIVPLVAAAIKQQSPTGPPGATWLGLATLPVWKERTKRRMMDGPEL